MTILWISGGDQQEVEKGKQSKGENKKRREIIHNGVSGTKKYWIDSVFLTA